MNGESRPGALGGLEIISGTKGASGAANNQHAGIVVGLERTHHLIELAEQLLRHRVQLLGSIERESADFVFDFLENYRFVGRRHHDAPDSW